MINLYLRNDSKPAGATNSVDIIKFQFGSNRVDSSDIDELFVEAFRQRVGDVTNFMCDDDFQSAYENWILSRKIEIDYQPTDDAGLPYACYTSVLKSIKGPHCVACMIDTLMNPEFEMYLNESAKPCRQHRYEEVISVIENQVDAICQELSDDMLEKAFHPVPTCLNDLKLEDKVVIVNLKTCEVYDGEVSNINTEYELMSVRYDNWVEEFYICSDWDTVKFAFSECMALFLTMDAYKEWISYISETVTNKQ